MFAGQAGITFRSAIFDEASCGTTDPTTIPKLTPMGIIKAIAIDSDGRPTVGIHDPDATDGREEPCGLLSTDILDADGNRDPNVDCPCSIITAGKVWRDKLPDDSLTNVADHPAKAAGGDVLVAGTASESDTVTVTVDGDAVVVNITNADIASEAAGA